MISQRVRYALKAMLSLAAAPPGESVMIGTIAKEQNIPENFLAIILLELKRSGLVQSRRGREGGYFLAKPPDQIYFGHIIRMIEGPIALLPCVSQTQYRRCDDCVNEKDCALRKVLAEVRESSAAILDGHTLQDALDDMQSQPSRASRAAAREVQTKKAVLPAKKRYARQAS